MVQNVIHPSGCTNDRTINLMGADPKMFEQFARSVDELRQSLNDSVLAKLPVDLLLSIQSSNNGGDKRTK